MTRPALLLALLAAPAVADDRVVEPGTPLTPDDAAHVFAHTCLVPPAELEASAGDLVATGVMTPVEPVSADDAALRYETADGLAQLAITAGEGGASCEMGLADDAGDLGPALLAALTDHVATLAPQGATTEELAAGQAWAWEADGTPHRIELLQAEDAFLLRRTAGDAVNPES